MELDKNIIFYDGNCGFCNLSVQFVLKHERKPETYFSSLQSDFAKQFFHDQKLPEPDLSTFYYYTNGILSQKSTAALKVIPKLKWYLRFGVIAWIIPKILRDGMYNFIAKRRKKLAKNFCLLPTADQQKRFLK